MPVTKKKGAIFAVYADTPPRAGPAPREPSEPREARDGRRALANIEPAPTRRKASPSGKRRVLAPRSPTRASSSRSKMDVFVDPEADKPALKTRAALAAKPLASKPLSSKPLSSSSKSVSSKPLASKPLASQPLAKPTSSSLSKPTLTQKRALPKRARSPTDKENAVLPDSPAGRTRSKLRLPEPPAEKKSAKKMARAFTVFADPLADVSEAYGASGDEPEGFREQGASRKAIRS